MTTRMTRIAIAFALIGIAYGAYPLGKAWAQEEEYAGTCCTYSSDCPGSDICYKPSDNQADCSSGHKNYCRP